MLPSFSINCTSSTKYILLCYLLCLYLLRLLLYNSVRVSNELGAGHPKSAAFSVVVATGTSLLVAIVFAIVTFSLRHKISYAFTSGEVVSNSVVDLMPFLAGAIVLDGIQPVLSGKYYSIITRLGYALNSIQF